MEQQLSKWEEIKRASADKAAKRKALRASTPRPLVFERNGLGPVLISLCPTTPGHWRATTFYANLEPSGHCSSPSFSDVVNFAIDVGGNVYTVRDATELTAKDPNDKARV